MKKEKPVTRSRLSSIERAKTAEPIWADVSNASPTHSGTGGETIEYLMN